VDGHQSHLKSQVSIPITPGPHVIERATLFDNVGFLLRLRFPPTLYHKSPNILFRANNVQVGTGFSISIIA
jgi:hypothetical protein